MPDGVKNVAVKIKEMPLSRKIAIGLVTFFILAVLSTIILKGIAKPYDVLYSSLAEKDSARVVEQLQKLKIPYKLEAGGRTIFVPRENVYELRLKLAGDDVVQGYSFGYELFDKANYGMTEFERKVNYKRAIQGELERSILQLSNVKAARVHIVMAKKAVFEEYEEPAKASVVLDVGNSKLSKSQIKGITNLVAGSVEGMSPNSVSVIDGIGNILFKGSPEEDYISMATSELDLKSSMERDLERKVLMMLNPVLGEGRAVAKATIELDLKKKEDLMVTYDPDSAVVINEQKSEESSENRRPTAGGVTGAGSNIPTSSSAGSYSPGDDSDSSNRVDSTKSYELSKTTSKIVDHNPKVNRLTIAVTIDKKREKNTDDEGKTVTEVKEWDTKEITGFESMVQAAVGYDQERGDNIVISQSAFTVYEQVESQLQSIETMKNRNYYKQYIQYGLMALGLILFFVFLIRPLMRVALGEKEQELAAQQQAALPGEEELMLPEQQLKALDSKPYHERVAFLVDTDIDRVSHLMQKWINS